MCRRTNDSPLRQEESDAALLRRLGWKNIMSCYWQEPGKRGLWREDAAAARARRLENEELARMED